MTPSRVVRHHPDMLPSDDITPEVTVEDDLLLKRHDVLGRIEVCSEELVRARDPIDMLPATAGIRLEVGGEADVVEDFLPGEWENQIREGIGRRVGRMLVRRQDHG